MFVLNAKGIKGFTAIPLIRVAWGVVLAIGFYLYALRLVHAKRMRMTYSKHMLGYLFIGIVGLIVGLLNGNSPIYILGDFAYVVIAMALYVITQNSIVNVPRNVGRRAIMIAIGMPLLYVTLLRVLHLNTFLPSILVLAIVVNVTSILQERLLPSILSVAFLLVNLSDLSRAILLTWISLFVFSLGLFVYHRRRNCVRLITRFAAVSALILVGLIIYARADPTTPLARRIRETPILVSGGTTTTVQQRVFEVKLVLESNKSMVDWVVGHGDGATLNMQDSLDNSVKQSAVLGENAVHNIHLLPVAILFRSGLAGLVWLLGFGYVLIQRAIKLSKYDSLLSGLLPIAMVIFALPASEFFFAEPLLWVGIAWSDYKYAEITHTPVLVLVYKHERQPQLLLCGSQPHSN